MKQKPKKILFAGGGTGGHFYPAIAVAESLRAISTREGVVDVDFFYMSDSPYDKALLDQVGFGFVPNMAGKRRAYFSILNYTDIFKTLIGCVTAFVQLLVIYPDVIFGKGGYASFPAMFAARLLRIPVVIHESDIIPGAVNKWIGDYAIKIAVSYPEAINYFKHKDRIALTGQPIRKELIIVPTEDPYVTLALEPGIPTILVIGGSQGAEMVNDNLLDVLPRVLNHYQVVHQAGEKNFDRMQSRVAELMADHPGLNRYHPYPFLDSKQLRLAAKAASLIISRAGSAVFEIALWGRASIIIPLPTARNDHQRENAYSYARSGACIVVEEQNLKPEVFFSVIQSVLEDEGKRNAMVEATKQFAKSDAADKIALLLLSIASQHD